MNNPGHIDDLHLGAVAGIPVKAKASANSAVANLSNDTIRLAVHLVIVAENEGTTWKEAAQAGLRHGDLVSLAHENFDRLVQHFLPGLEPQNAACRFEVNSSGAASRPTLHTHVIIADKTLFGDGGVIRRCVDDIRNPRTIVSIFLSELREGLDTTAQVLLQKWFPQKNKKT